MSVCTIFALLLYTQLYFIFRNTYWLAVTFSQFDALSQFTQQNSTICFLHPQEALLQNIVKSHAYKKIYTIL